MYLYGPSDRNRLFLLFSYLGLVNCMGKKHHEIVYMKLWPNMNSKLWKCTILTDFRVYHHSPPHFALPYPQHPLKLTKRAWLCAKPACCAPSDASMLRDESFDHNGPFISFVISRGLHHGLLPKSDKVAESTHQNGLVFYGRNTVPATDLQLPVLWAHVASLVKTSRGWASCWHQFFLVCRWQWRQKIEVVPASALSHVTSKKRGLQKGRHPE